jgi:ribose transport system substrate-binding protein
MRPPLLSRLTAFSLASAAVAVLSAAISMPSWSQEDAVLFLGRANARVAKAMAYPVQWDGPADSVKPAARGLIIFIGSDMRDNALGAVAKGLKEASDTIGWSSTVIDCFGMPGRRPEAFSRALALKPAGIVLAGFDARELGKAIESAAAQKIPVIGWHAAARPGPADGMFTNVGSDPREVGQIAALLTVVESKGKAGVVVLTDNTSLYSAAKSNAVVETLRKCQTCSVLSVADLPPAGNDSIQQEAAALRKRFGTRWTHAVGSSDQYFDTMASPLLKASLSTDSLQAVGAGNGSPAAFERIGGKNLQIGTVPEPLNLHGWQLVDEILRAQAGLKPSGYVTPSYVVTAANIAYHGGQKNSFDPSNGYRAQYRKNWGR